MADKKFNFISKDTVLDKEQARESLTYWQDVWRRLKNNRLSMAGLIGVILIVLFGIAGPWFSPYSYSDQVNEFSNLPPRIDIRRVHDDKYIMVAKDYRMIEVTEDGHLVERLDRVYQDAVKKQYFYRDSEFLELVERNGFGTYPLTETIDDQTYYSERWGIALRDSVLGTNDNYVQIAYIHPDSPFNDLTYNDKSFEITNEFSLTEMTLWTTGLDNPDSVNPVLTTVTEGQGAEYIIDALEVSKNIQEVEIGEPFIMIDFSYKLMDPEDRPEGYEDVEISLTYLGNENKYVDDTVWNRTYRWGSDSLGRDVLTRVMYGARISLTVAAVATLVNFFIGVFYGSIAGYAGGRVDNFMMRFVDIVNSIPLILYVILLMVWLREVYITVPLFGRNITVFRGGAGLGPIILALASVYWVQMARLVRGQILGLKEQEFVLAARTIGVSNRKIIARHLIPNAMGPIIVSMTMMIPSAVFTEAFLSFIGLGISAPQASWGTLANDALGGLTTYPYQLFFPAAAIAVTMLAFNFLGDGLRDALDPRLRKG